MLTRKVDEIGINRVTVRLLGDEYVVSGRDAPTHLTEVTQDVESRLQEVQAAQPKLAKTQLAMLIALKLADELCKLRREHEEMLRLVQEAK